MNIFEEVYNFVNECENHITCHECIYQKYCGKYFEDDDPAFLTLSEVKDVLEIHPLYKDSDI